MSNLLEDFRGSFEHGQAADTPVTSSRATESTKVITLDGGTNGTWRVSGSRGDHKHRARLSVLEGKRNEVRKNEKPECGPRISSCLRDRRSSEVVESPQGTFHRSLQQRLLVGGGATGRGAANTCCFTIVPTDEARDEGKGTLDGLPDGRRTTDDGRRTDGGEISSRFSF